MSRARASIIAASIAAVALFTTPVCAEEPAPRGRLELDYEVMGVMLPAANAMRIHSIYPFSTPARSVPGFAPVGFAIGDGARVALRNGIVLPIAHVQFGYAPLHLDRDLGGATTMEGGGTWWVKYQAPGFGYRVDVDAWTFTAVLRSGVLFAENKGEARGPRGRYPAWATWWSLDLEGEIEVCAPHEPSAFAACAFAAPMLDLGSVAPGGALGIRAKAIP